MKKLMKYKRTIIFIALGVLILFFLNNSFKEYYNPTKIKSWILGFGNLSFLTFMLLQIMQVIVFFIPGEVMQTAGGYIFGTLGGTGLSIVGILMGSSITFLLARAYGNNLLEKILPQKDYIKARTLINKSKNKWVFFILYLMPGFPKDVLGYLAGITPIGIGEFLLYSTVARIPGILASTYIGFNLYNQNYGVVFISLAFVVILVCIGMLKREEIIRHLK